MVKNSNLNNLKKLKREYKNERKGYHYRQYEILANTMPIVVELRDDESAVKKFLKLAGKTPHSAKREKTEGWLTAAVVAYVTGATSENAIKLAWKRARVLEHLHDFHEVPSEEIAAEIRTRGGIEAVANMAAKEDPRRQKRHGAAHGKKNKGGAVAKKGAQSKSCDIDQAKSADEDENGPEDWYAPQSKGQDQQSEIAVSISPDLRTKLQAIAVGRRVKLICVRKDDDWGTEVMLEARQVRSLKT